MSDSLSKTDSLTIKHLGEELLLLPEKALFWPKRRILVVSDAHIGKSGHFRKNGIPVPAKLNDDNLNQLDRLVKIYNPNTLLFLGDLFHSDPNEEISQFLSWRKEKTGLEIFLTVGNHDEYTLESISEAQINLIKYFEADPFTFLHDPADIPADPTPYYIAGHIHPSIRLKGKGRQSIRAACFYFGNNYAVMPAFGTFTGTHTLKPKKNEHIYAIIQNEVLNVSK